MGDIIARIGEFVKRHREAGWQCLVLCLIGWSAYNIGTLRGQSAAPGPAVPLLEARDSIVSQTPAPGRGSGVDRSDTRVVVSKSSASKKYHYSWCSSALRIKEENRVWFPTAAAAQAAGYSLAGNCSE